MRVTQYPTNLLDMKKDPYSEDGNLAAPKEIVDLVERFESKLEGYKTGYYDRIAVRISPVFAVSQ